MIVNNNYPNGIIDKHVKNYISNKKKQNEETTNKKTNINIYYKNQMHVNYYLD